MSYVPVVDISADPSLVGAELDEICRTVGFFQVIGHGIADGWTNDRWRSTLHWVVDPHQAGTARRQSMPYFQNANWSARIACLPTCLEPGDTPRYEPVLAGPHLMSRFRKSVTLS